MKKTALITLLGLALVASQALAFWNSSQVNENSTWKEIANNPSLKAQMPQIPFSGHKFLISVSDVCHFDNATMLDGGTSKTCVKYSSSGNNTDCIKYKTVELVKPRTYEKTSCVQYSHNGENCIKYQTYLKTHPLTYNVSVKKVVGEKETFLFKKEFTIPACED